MHTVQNIRFVVFGKPTLQNVEMPNFITVAGKRIAVFCPYILVTFRGFPGHFRLLSSAIGTGKALLP